jgi:outer membrane protein OmpA-like peptidoglycan-associated protein
MKNVITILVIFSSICLNVTAQEKTKKESRGDAFNFLNNFEKAIGNYEATMLTEEGLRKYAIALQKAERYLEAEIQFANLVNSSKGKVPEDYFRYATSLKQNEKYTEYFIWMDQFAVLQPNDLRVKSYYANRGNFNSLFVDQKKQTIQHLDMNSAHQDFGIDSLDSKHVFTSNRTKNVMIKRIDNRTGEPFLGLYTVDVKERKTSNLENFDKQLKSKTHVGPASFSNQGTFMAFTRNNIKDKSDDKIVELQIFFSSFSNASWSEPIGFSYNDQSYSAGQPYLIEDGSTMYFVSNMSGGFGGTDIYKTVKDSKGNWSKPENLGETINTEGNEMFPFFEEEFGVLYFSSDGHFGMGGLDVFYVLNDKVHNLGAPVNSKNDDFALIIDSKSQDGFFSSNRTSGSGSDDLYRVHFSEMIKSELRIKGIATNKEYAALGGVRVVLTDENELEKAVFESREDGFYSFPISINSKYNVRGNKANYSEGRNTVQSLGNDSIIQCDIMLLELDDNSYPVDSVELNSDLATVVKLNPIYFDYDMYLIREDAAIELNKIVVILNKNPSMEIILKSYTDCRGSAAYNQYLSDKRAVASAEYIQARISNPQRITGKGYGESNSLNDCICEDDVISDCPKEQHQENRRTQFIILKK